MRSNPVYAAERWIIEWLIVDFLGQNVTIRLLL